MYSLSLDKKSLKNAQLEIDEKEWFNIRSIGSKDQYWVIFENSIAGSITKGMRCSRQLAKRNEWKIVYYILINSFGRDFDSLET